MRSIFIFTLLATVLLTSGCANLHPDPPHLSSATRIRLAPQYYQNLNYRGKGGPELYTAQREATNKAVQDILGIKPTENFSKEKPLTLAIAEVGSDGVETIRQEQKEEWRNRLEATGLVKVIFISSVIVSQSPNFHELRLAAARLHADKMLLYASVSSDESKSNLAGFLYMTVVGAFFVPGSQAACITYAKGACFDVNNEYLEFAVEGEDERNIIRPYYFLDEKELEIASTKEALSILQDETVAAIELRVKSK